MKYGTNRGGYIPIFTRGLIKPPIYSKKFTHVQNEINIYYLVKRRKTAEKLLNKIWVAVLRERGGGPNKFACFQTTQKFSEKLKSWVISDAHKLYNGYFLDLYCCVMELVNWDELAINFIFTTKMILIYKKLYQEETQPRGEEWPINEKWTPKGI